MKFKRYAIFAVFGLLIISLYSLQSTQAQRTAIYGEGFPHTADGEGFPMVSPITIDLPINTAYTIKQMSLNFTVKTLFSSTQGSAIMTYSLDGKENITIPTTIEFIPVYATVTDAKGKQTTEISPFASYHMISGSVNLRDLQPGRHSLTVFGRYTVYSMPDKVGLDSQTVYFTVGDESLPVVSAVSVDGDVSKSEPTFNKFYAAAGVFLLVVVIACALFIKYRQTTKGK
jgi:hypothetical protein